MGMYKIVMKLGKNLVNHYINWRFTKCLNIMFKCIGACYRYTGHLCDVKRKDRITKQENLIKIRSLLPFFFLAGIFL